jgi:hypothetical protein
MELLDGICRFVELANASGLPPTSPDAPRATACLMLPA